MSKQRNVGAIAGSAVLTLAAAGGLLCIILVILAGVFNVTLIMFKTGSMSPAIPAGSLAVVRLIPASEAHVGDVVTVDRPGALPVTHRVTSVTPDGASSVLTLKGDANDTPDPSPYTVTHVRVVLFAVPQLAYVVVAASEPLVLGVTTCATAALVTWAFWPRQGVSVPHRRKGRGRHVAGAGPGIAILVALLVSVSAPAAPARAADPFEEVTTGRYLTLVSIGDRASMLGMPVDQPVLWQVGVSAHAAEPGTVDIRISSSGSLALQVEVAVCPTRFVSGSCAGGGSVVAAGDVTGAIGDGMPVATMASDRQVWVLVSATLPEAHAGDAGHVTMTISASGYGEEIAVGGNASGLAPTGVDILAPTLMAVAGVGAGLALALVRRRVAR